MGRTSLTCQVSLVCFNSNAKTLVHAAPVTRNFVEELRKEGCTGGTCFSSAWEKIAECAEGDPKFARIFVVFLTDGLSSDITSTVQKVNALQGSLDQQKRSMCSFFVHIAEKGSATDDVQKRLEPLVKAANGGQKMLEYTDEKISLLQLVKVEDLTSVFEKLTSLVNLHKCILEARIATLRMQERDFKEKSELETKALQTRYKEKAKELKEASRAFGKVSKTDKNALEKMYQKLQREMEDEQKMLEKELKAAQQKELELTKDLKKCACALDLGQKELDTTQEAYNHNIESLQKVSKTHLSQLGHIGNKQQKASFA